jgi:hypothetical protein
MKPNSSPDRSRIALPGPCSLLGYWSIYLYHSRYWPQEHWWVVEHHRMHQNLYEIIKKIRSMLNLIDLCALKIKLKALKMQESNSLL